MTASSFPLGQTLFLSDADVRAAFDWKEAVATLREAYSVETAEEMFPPRSMARGDGMWLRTLSGILPTGDLMGAKLIAASMKAKAASYLIPLFDQETMALVALLDGNSITGLRTAATSALAADLLANPGPLRVAVIGSGFEAKSHARAIAALRPIEEMKVFSPRATSRAGFINDLDDLGISIAEAGSAQEAIAGASLIICAARSRDESPTLCGAWLEAGQTIVSIGSTLPEQREIDAKAISRAALIVADMAHEVAHDTGDMIAAQKEGVAFADRIIGLDQLVSGKRRRTRADEILLYKSVGAALQDLTIAAFCARRAHRSGAGTVLPVTIKPVNKGK